MAPPPPTTIPLNNHSAFNSIPPSNAPTIPPGSPTNRTPATSGPLHIAANQRENVALARQLTNHQQCLCYQLPRYYQCGHPAGPSDLLLSHTHIARLGYGTACDADCAVDYSRRTIDPKQRCPGCFVVDECFAVVMRLSCGHLAGVFSSAGRAHDQRIGMQMSCDAWCHSVQVLQEVGGACELCTFAHCYSKYMQRLELYMPPSPHVSRVRFLLSTVVPKFLRPYSIQLE